MGSFGAGELLILVILALAIYGTVVGAVRAFRNGDTGWGIAIIVTWLIGLGWLLGWIYLLSVGRSKEPTRSLPDPPDPPLPPPPPNGPGTANE